MNRAGIRLRVLVLSLLQKPLPCLVLSLLLMPLPCLALPPQSDPPPDLHLNDPKPTTVLVRVVARRGHGVVRVIDRGRIGKDRAAVPAEVAAEVEVIEKGKKEEEAGEKA